MKKIDGEAAQKPFPALPIRAERIKTELAFKTANQAYLWFTDRGRARIIKH